MKQKHTNWKVLVETEGGNLVTIYLKAFNKSGARNRALKASNGCKIKAIDNDKEDEIKPILMS